MVASLFLLRISRLIYTHPESKHKMAYYINKQDYILTILCSYGVDINLQPLYSITYTP